MLADSPGECQLAPDPPGMAWLVFLAPPHTEEDPLVATTKKPTKSPTKSARPRGVIKKKSNVTAAAVRSRRPAARRVPWEHLGHPASGVIVTGGASGIGRACALHLAEAGRPVAIWDRDEKGAKKTAELAKSRFKVKAHVVAFDVSDTRAFRHAITASKKALGPIGGLVHAAGIDGACEVTDLTDEAWSKVLDINLTAAALLTKELTPTLVEAGPGSAIVYLSSIEGFFGHAFLPAYSASKAGLLGLTRSACATLGPKGVRVNSICPGAIETPLLAPLLAIDGVQANLEGRTPLGRLGSPDDIAKVVRFLLSEESAFITGASLVVDGGLTAIAGI